MTNHSQMFLTSQQAKNMLCDARTEALVQIPNPRSVGRRRLELLEAALFGEDLFEEEEGFSVSEGGGEGEMNEDERTGLDKKNNNPYAW